MKKNINTNYRLVWNSIQNAFVVVSELASSKGKKTASVVTLSALSSLASIPAFAVNECGNNEVTMIGNCTVIEAGETKTGLIANENNNLWVNGSTNGTTLTGKENEEGSGSSFDDGTTFDSATEWVNTGGSANGTVVNAGGVQKVVGGEVSNSTVHQYGAVEVYSGTIKDSIVGTDNATNGLKKDEAYIVVRGDNSYADNIIIENGGVLGASEGATVANTTINAGGRLELSVLDDHGSPEHEGASANKITTANDVTINKDGVLAIDSGTKAKDVTVNNGAIIWAEDGSILENVTTVGGETTVINATLSGNNTFNQEGTLTVSGDVTAENIALYDANISFKDTPNPTEISSRNSQDSGFSAATLTVKNLNGQGENNITMRVDATTGEHDTLKVTESIGGNFNVSIDSSGKELNDSALDNSFIEAKGSNPDTFTGTSDIGSYNYSLYQDGDDWKLQRNGKLSSSANNAIMLANVTPTIWASELSVLRNRLGELRYDSEQNGVWLKYITSRNRVNNNQVSYKQDMNGFVLGGDRKLDLTGGKLFLGSQFSYSYSSLDASDSDGQVKSYSVGMYATWLHDDGYYMDGVIKGNRFFSENNANFNQGKSKASDATNGIGFSIEGGKHINIDSYLIEPYIQLSGFQGQKTNYDFDNGLRVNANSTRSFKAEVGTTLGKEFSFSNGSSASPYIRLAANQEFVKNNDVTINNTERFTNDMSGLTGKYGVGINASIVKDLNVYGEFNYAKGNKLETPYSGTLGVRYSF